MPRRPALVARVLAHPRLAIVAVSMITVLAAIAAAVALGDDGSSRDPSAADDVDAARVVSTTNAPTSTTAVVTTTSTTTTVAPTTVAPTAPPTPAPTAPPTTAAPPPPPAPVAPPAPVGPSGTRCLVRLHGKGGSGSGTSSLGAVTVLSPGGNASGWGGRQWVYEGGSYDAARASIVQAVDAAGCGQVIVNGFSNGGAMAVKLHCRGETFGGRLVRVVADDPVPDHGADGCAGSAPLTIYWTGALDGAAKPGWNCAEQDWTCEGGSTVGISAYAANAGAALKASPHQGHQWYMDAPELGAWA